jgi:CHAT domain-containing protein
MAQGVSMTDFGIAYHFGAYNKATSFGEQLLLRPSVRQNKIQQLNITTKLGDSYTYLGDYNRGLEHLQWAIDSSSQDTEQLTYKIIALHQQGFIHFELNQTEEAQEAFTAILDWKKSNESLFRKDSTITDIYARTLIGIAQTTFAQQDYVQSKAFSFKAIQYIEKNLLDTALLAQSYLQLSQALGRIGDFNLSQQYLQQSIQISNQYPTQKGLDWINFHHRIAAFFLKTDQIEEALTHNQQALSILFPQVKAGQLPTKKTVEYTNSPSIAAMAIAQRAMIQSADTEQKTWITALESYRLLDHLIYRLKRTYTDQSAQLLWSQKSLKYYTKAIQTALLLHEQTKDEKYKALAFEFSEKSKSSILLGAFQRAKAQKIANVPSSILQQETDYRQAYEELRSEVTILEQKRFLTTDVKTKIQQLKGELQVKKQTYEDYLIKIKKNYPDYYKLKFDIQVVDVPSIQESLETDQLLIEYFIGKKEVIIFKIGKYKFEVFQKKIIGNLENDIMTFRESIYGYFLKTKRIGSITKETYWTQYNDLGYKLYQTLLAPALKDTHEDRLTIILAGHLGLLPFEALLTEKNTTKNFKKVPYLVKNCALSYCYSASLLKEMKDKPHRAEKIFLGFAPKFDSKSVLEGKYQFDPLEHSEKEVSSIFNLVDMMGEVFDGEQATKETFQEKCQDYCIVHVATHGMMDSRNSDASFLAFSEVKDSNDNELLYVKELYNMNMTAELVVLSACETGIGQLEESEGVASLARGFSYAGAKSIITSLWAVNDFATAEIMQQLYKNLKNGMPKDKALQAAKLYLINNASVETAHPFLWSAFIQIGDETPLPQPEVEKKEGSLILAIFGLMHWVFIGVIILAAIWAGISQFIPKYNDDE